MSSLGVKKVIDPQGRVYQSEQSGNTQTTKVFPDTGSTTSHKTVQTTWAYDDTTTKYNPRPSEVLITDNFGNARKTKFTYTLLNDMSLPQYVDEMVGASDTVYRRTITQYTSHPAQRILGLPSTVGLYAGAGTTLLSETTYQYDQYNQASATEKLIDATGDGVAQRDNAGYGNSFFNRGNVTAVVQSEVVNGSRTGNSRAVSRTQYDTSGNVRAVTDAAGNRTEFTLTDNFSNKPAGVGQTHGTVSAVKDPAGYSNGAQYDYFSGQPVKTYHIGGLNNPNGPRENEVTYIYDSADRRLQVSRADGAATTFHHWDNWLAEATFTLIEAGKESYSFTAFDGAGNVRWVGGDHPEAVSGKYWLRKFGYDSAGREQKVSNATAVGGGLQPDGEDAGAPGAEADGFLYTTYTLDTLDRPVTVTRPGGNTVGYSYTGCGCAGGSTLEVTDERGKRRKSVRDFLGRLSEAHDVYSTGANAGQTYSRAVYTYSALDQLTKIEHYDGGTVNRQDRTFVYDGYGRLQSQTTPEAGTVSYTYYPHDRVQTLQNQRLIPTGQGLPNEGQPYTTTFTYNSRGLLTDVNYNDKTPDVRYEYGEYGERKEMKEKRWDTGEVIGSTTYAYDAYVRLQSETRAFNGLSGTYQLSYLYNLADGLTRVSYNVNGWQRNVNYAYKYSGALAGVGTNIRAGAAADNTSNVATNFQYRGFGAVKQMDYGNGQQLWADYGVDRQQLKQLVVRGVNAPANQTVNKSYNYTLGGNGGNNGRVQRVTDNLENPFSVTYDYDDFNRLKSAQADDVLGSRVYTREYTYDAWANLTSSAGAGGELPTYTLTYEPVGGGNNAPKTNRLWGGWAYDAAGNLTVGEGWTRTYDAANRITSANAVTMEYDGDGRRVKNDEAGAGNITLYYLWSSVLGEVVADLRPDFAEVYHIPFRAYIHGPGGGTPIAMQGYNTGFYYLYADHLGSGHKVADEAGNVVQRFENDPHGQSVLETGSFGSWFNQKKFTGYERDYAGGTYYAKARQYQPYRARFFQPDPLGLAASDLTNPQSLNLYSYVHNDPVNLVDPDGLNPALIDGLGLCVNRQVVTESGSYRMVDCLFYGQRSRDGGFGGGGEGGGRGGGLQSKQQNQQANTDCLNFVEAIISIVEARASNLFAALSIGKAFAKATIEQSSKAKTTVTGFRKEMTANGQDSDVYRHVFGGAASVLLDGGNSAAYQDASDKRQQSSDPDLKRRREASAELAGTQAGRKVGSLVLQRVGGEINKDQLRAQLRSRLCQ